MSGNPIGETRKFWRLAADYVSDRLRSRAAVRELDALGPAESAQVLGDSGMSPFEFRAAMRRPFASEDLLVSAMNAVGIDPAKVASDSREAYRDLCRNCMLCEHRLRCHNDLGCSSFARNHQDYCPNSGHFLELMGSGRTRGRRH
jgi:hypothetical protein